MATAFLAMAVLATAGVVFYFSTTVNAKASGADAPAQKALASKSRTMSPAKSISLPLFFEPNQGQTAPQVKFVARGAGYGLFLTSDEAVLKLQHSALSTQHSAPGSHLAVRSAQPVSNSVIRMKLDGANSAASVSGAEPLPGKSNYFIGNDPAKWRRNIPQFARVEYKSVYPGVDLVYYGDQGQLEYDFRVAPAADPNRIALSFTGAASTRIESGDLILATDQGEVRFHAPRIYQQNENGNTQKPIAGSFRQLADNKIGFTIGDYDRSRELVIDPVLNYSTYFGNPGTNGGEESLVNLAVDSSGNIYLAGATTSNDFYDRAAYPGNDRPPFQPDLNGAQNVFIAVINPNPPSGSSQLVYATYLGGSGTDSPAGIAVSTNVDSLMTGVDIYVAGTTSSADFPISSTPAGLPPFQKGPPTDPGKHGFVTRLNVSAFDVQGISTLRYSTYLSGTNAAGTATDMVTGLAIDVNGDAYVTGVTTSTNDQSNGFPANANGFQTQPNEPTSSFGNRQFFASKIDTKSNGGSLSMIYSTYFGGGNFNGPLTVEGGGITVDPSPNSAPNMYITGQTNYLPGTTFGFPLFNAQQSCLDEAGNHGTCTLPNPQNANGFVAKINPNQNGFDAPPLYSTYIGGTGPDAGIAIAVDSTGNAYVTGSTTSSDWVSVGSGFQTQLCNGVGTGCRNAFIAKIGNQTGSIYPLTYFSYLGGTGLDGGNAIQVDSLQAVHVVGSTTSTAPSFPVTTNALQPQNGGGQDAFVAVIGTTLSGKGAGDLVTFLGGTGTDQGTGVAIDPVYGATYVAGTTLSPNFPTQNPYQATLNGPQQAAFVSTIGASSNGLTVFPSTTSPAPNPVAAGTQVAFTFEIGNSGPDADTASQVIFTASNIPTTGLATTPTAKITSGTGSCGAVQGSTITCIIPTLTVCTTANCSSASVEVDVTPAITGTAQSILITGQATANNNSTVVAKCTTCTTAANIVDFKAGPPTPPTTTINAGDTATFQISFCTTTSFGYNFPITPSQTSSPSIVTATTPTFSPTPVTPGNTCGTTTLRIPTVARPVTTSGVFRRGSFYAAWLPIAGLSLVSLGIGAGRKRRRWLAAVVLGLIAGAILLQSACGSSGSSVNPGGGTQAGTYIITITGSAGSAASHSTTATLFVN